MLTLHGYPGSIYTRIVKLALLEKAVAFEEVNVPLHKDGSFELAPGYRDKSPMGKIPCLQTDAGPLTETSVILDYLEEQGEGPSFYPSDAFARAKVKELMKCIELYIELPARRVYGEFFTRPVSDAEKGVVRELLESGFAAFQSLARFDPYLAGPQISYADFFGLYALPTATAVTREVYGWDTYNWISGLRGWLALMQERDCVQSIEAQRRKVEDS
jgi:glutathione S-transferase